MDHDIDPGIREYTRIFTLPESVIYENKTWSVLLLGKAGRVVFLDLNESTPMANRTYKPPNGKRPGNCGESSDQSTALPLLTLNRGPELLIMGGCTSDRDTMKMADVYNVRNDSWTRVQTHIVPGHEFKHTLDVVFQLRYYFLMVEFSSSAVRHLGSIRTNTLNRTDLVILEFPLFLIPRHT